MRSSMSATASRTPIVARKPRTSSARLPLLPDGGTPTPEALLLLSDEALRGVGLSRQKLGYVRDLSAKMGDGSINTADLHAMSDDEIVAEARQVVAAT